MALVPTTMIRIMVNRLAAMHMLGMRRLPVTRMRCLVAMAVALEALWPTPVTLLCPMLLLAVLRVRMLAALMMKARWAMRWARLAMPKLSGARLMLVMMELSVRVLEAVRWLRIRMVMPPTVHDYMH